MVNFRESAFALLHTRDNQNTRKEKKGRKEQAGVSRGRCVWYGVPERGTSMQ